MTASVSRPAAGAGGSAAQRGSRPRRARRHPRPAESVARLHEAGFAEAWAATVAGTSYIRMTDEQLVESLRGFAGRLAELLSAEPFTATAAYQIGVDLVGIDLTAPEALGRTVGLISGRFLDDLFLGDPTPAPDDAQARLSALLEMLSTGYARAQRARTLDEQEAIRQAALVASSRAQQELRATEDQLLHAALHDPLTGLANRTLMMDRLTRALERAAPGQRLGVCLVGLDAFGSVTDSLGHQVGDQVLRAVAERLNNIAGAASDGGDTADNGETVRTGRTVAHLGADRFAILVEDTTCADDVVKVADQALTALATPIRVDDHDLPISAHAGIIEGAAEGSDPAEVMRAADITLHWARTDDRARWAVFDPERNARDVARYRLSAAMPAALERGEFFLDYQPLVRLSDGTLRGVEALARWHHPEHGVLPPDKFIDLAEDTGLIVPLGLRLLDEACCQAAEWHRESTQPPFVSVNLAARQLKQPGLVADVAAILDRSGLRPRYLQLEVTEGDLIGSDAATIEVLRALGNLGIRLAIDDFGTGYANIAYLPDLPVHTIKLAGSFVQRLSPEIERDDVGEAMLSMLVRLGHTLGMSVTAEGIETPSQARRLTAIGCDLGQGWHFGRPGPAHRISDRLLNRPTTRSKPADDRG